MYLDMGENGERIEVIEPDMRSNARFLKGGKTRVRRTSGGLRLVHSVIQIRLQAVAPTLLSCL
jgi:hypothetical protein